MTHITKMCVCFFLPFVSFLQYNTTCTKFGFLSSWCSANAMAFLQKESAMFLQRPSTVNIGAILSFNSTIGRVAKVAIEAAVDDINSNPTVLNGTKLNVSMQDTKLSTGFLGIIDCTSLSKTFHLSTLHFCTFFPSKAYIP